VAGLDPQSADRAADMAGADDADTHLGAAGCLREDLPRLQGRSNARRKMLLDLLEHAGIALTEADRAQIQACAETATLDRWIKNVLSAKTAAEVLS